MLGFLRTKKVKKVVLWILALLIIPAFALMGTNYLNANKKYIANIYGKKVYNSDFISYQKNYGAYLKLNFGPNAFEDLNSEDMYNYLWEQFILIQKAKHDKIKVSDEEVIAFFSTFFALNQNGRFNKEAYLAFLKQANIVPAQFEKFIKDMVAAEKVVETKYAALTSTEEELREMYKSKTEEAEIEYIFISHRDTQIFLDENATEQELKDFYNLKPELFKTLPEAKMKYVLVKELPETFNIKKVNTLEEAAKALNAEVVSSDFFTVNDEIGALGTQNFIAQETINSELNKIIGPFPIDKGHIIFAKVDSKESYIPAFTNVEEKVRKRYAYETAEDKAKERAMNIFEEVKATNNVKEIADKYNVYYSKSKAFKLYDEIDDKLLLYKPFNTAIFNLTENRLMDKPFEFEHGWAITKRISFKAMTEEQFQKEKEEYKTKLLRTKKQLAYKQLIREIREESKLEINTDQ